MKNRRRQLIVYALAVFTAIFTVWWAIDCLRYRALHKMPDGLRHFYVYQGAPACARWKDHMPKTRAPDTYRLYIEARKLWRSKIEWQLTRTEAQRILTDVAVAAERGDWGARAVMAKFYRDGLGPLDGNNVLQPDAGKAVAIARMAVAAGQPWGFYDLGVAHEYGYGGAVVDHKIAWAYYLKAAELGSPDAQMALADAYSDAKQEDFAEMMRQCAFNQGHGPAASELALQAKVHGNAAEALKFYQNGVSFGDEKSAGILTLLFDEGYWGRKKDIEALGIVIDKERGRRYRILSEALHINPDLRFTHLDDYLPLPPAKLPEWRGIEALTEIEPAGLPTY